MITKNFRSLGGVALAGLLSLSGIARAGTSTSALFDFEDQTVSSSNLTTLTVSNAGLSATVTRSGQDLNIVDLSAMSGTAAFGARTLSPTPTGTAAFNVDFSKPVTSFSAQFGDFGSNLTDTLTLKAFSGPGGTGSLLGTQTTSLPLFDTTTLAFKTLQFNGSGIKSVQLIGGAAGDNSVFFDNFAATVGPSGGPSAVPLPSAVLAAPLGGLVALFAARRLRRSPVAC